MTQEHHGVLDTAPVHVDDTGGTGRPVVLIHGWPLSGESWGEQVDALVAEGYRVITYDRRGFGRSEKPESGYEYDTLADDLAAVLEARDLTDATLIGFSMGGGEVARYITRHGQDRLRSIVFAAAVPPYLAQTEDNPEGPLDADSAASMRQGLENDRDGFFDQFITDFFSVDGDIKVSEEQRQAALRLAHQSDQRAALLCMDAFAGTDFREDLRNVSVPTLVVHGNSDATVPLEGSGQRTHEAISGSVLHVIEGGPHGINTSHATEFNRAVLDFLDAN